MTDAEHVRSLARRAGMSPEALARQASVPKHMVRAVCERKRALSTSVYSRLRQAADVAARGGQPFSWWL